MPANLSRSQHSPASPVPPPQFRTPLEPLARRLLLVDRLSRLYEDARVGAERDATFRKMLQALDIQYEISERDAAKIPREGPVVAVANHPYGIMEGAIMAALLPRIRPDVRIMTNSLMWSLSKGEVDESLFLWVDPFGSRKSVMANRRPLREAIGWLREGGMLVVFPAGEVAHLDLKRRQILDQTWSRTIAGVIRLGEASALPVYFDGANSVLFQLLGLVHPSLRTVRLAHEFFNKRGRRVQVRVGSRIDPNRLAALGDDAGMMDYLYRRTYLLADRGKNRNNLLRPKPLIKKAKPGALRPVAAPECPEALRAEVESLSADYKLAEFDELAVYCAGAGLVPSVTREIGRLREISFRAVGEGTGKPFDLDTFDEYYDHLFVWHKNRHEVVGAYRLGQAGRIIAERGASALYTSTLFEFSEGFFEKLGPSLELGRSFVRPEYQKDFAPLMMLWKGIGAYVASNPSCRVLFGPVSISDDYQAASKRYMVRFLKNRYLSPELAPLVKPRQPFRDKKTRDWELDITGDFVTRVEDLSNLVADIETDGKGVPILVRQYLKLGGRLIEFNLDPKFSQALDGLIAVDLLQTDRKILQRYMGRENAHRFFSFHEAAATGARCQ